MVGKDRSSNVHCVGPFTHNVGILGQDGVQGVEDGVVVEGHGDVLTHLVSGHLVLLAL